MRGAWILPVALIACSPAASESPPEDPSRAQAAETERVIAAHRARVAQVEREEADRKAHIDQARARQLAEVQAQVRENERATVEARGAHERAAAEAMQRKAEADRASAIEAARNAYDEALRRCATDTAIARAPPKCPTDAASFPADRKAECDAACVKFAPKMAAWAAKPARCRDGTFARDCTNANAHAREFCCLGHGKPDLEPQPDP